MPRQKTEPIPTIISDAPAVRRIAEQLIPKYHNHLSEAVIVFLFTNKTRKKCQRVVLGSTKKLGPMERYLTAPDDREAQAHFLILVGEFEWAALTESQRIALVDHELSHMGAEEDDEGNVVYKLLGHDLEEFVAVVARHGLWKADVQALYDAAYDYEQSRTERPALLGVS